MKVYRICTLDGDGQVFHSFKLSCRDQDHALIEAKSICDRHFVEVWDGDKLVARISPEK